MEDFTVDTSPSQTVPSIPDRTMLLSTPDRAMYDMCDVDAKRQAVFVFFLQGSQWTSLFCQVLSRTTQSDHHLRTVVGQHVLGSRQLHACVCCRMTSSYLDTALLTIDCASCFVVWQNACATVHSTGSGSKISGWRLHEKGGTCHES